MEADSAKEIYTPHLKKVLRSFQASAHTSLHGPNSVMGLWATDTEKNSSEAGETSATATATSTAVPAAPAAKALSKTPEDDPFMAPPPFPIQQPPIFTPPDQSGCEKSETILENETISCFSVGGEKRLCLPQILNTVLRDFTLNQINFVCDNLHIFCSRSTPEQLEVLKNTGVLPLSAPSCGLITKSDAERLCSALVDSNPPKVMRTPDSKLPFIVKVYHECFGQCTGMYAPDLYLDPLARCIECTECHGLFNPQKFVCHAHQPKENRTCHWGFDSFKWRCYLLLGSEIDSDVHMKELLKEMKGRYDYSRDNAHKYKRKQILMEGRDPSKKVRMETFYPYPYTLDPSMVYWYPNPAWNKVAAAAFKPLPHPVITRDEKPLFIHPEALPHYLKERSPYFLHESSLIQGPEHVLPLVDSDRYETHYQASVTYSPAVVKRLEFKKDCSAESQALASYQSRKILEAATERPLLKKEHNYDSTSCYLDCEDAFSDTSSSTLSASTDDGLVLAPDEGSCSPPRAEDDLQSLTTLLKDSAVESSLCVKIFGEVEAVISRYRKCLKASIQGKKLMQLEFEKICTKQREKIRKLKETSKYMEKEMLKLQAFKTKSERILIDNTSSSKRKSPIDVIRETNLENADKRSSPSEGGSAKGAMSEEEERVEEERLEVTVGENVAEHVAKPPKPKETVDIKVEPIGK